MRDQAAPPEREEPVAPSGEEHAGFASTGARGVPARVSTDTLAAARTVAQHYAQRREAQGAPPQGA